MEVYSQVNRPPKVVLRCEEPSRTRQSERDKCDVNKIMARYEKTGMIPVDQRQAFFADVSTMGDYRTALDNVRRANEFFMSLPAKVRSRFENDAAAFLDFVSDPGNRGELVELGLVEPVEAPEAPAAPVEPEPGA